MSALNGRYYANKLIQAEYSPVSDFREAKCRQYKEGNCDRGGFCNFMHPKHLSRNMRRDLYDWMYKKFPAYLQDKKLREE